ncbi:MAG TPA: ABC transporter permease [Candidatus Saccharimonadia bacterium]|nr:ABC transporter permease [Candidatus Saccharimonadia bacterium]
MKLRRILAIARKQFLTLRHDPRTLALMLLAPIMAMLIFGFAFGSEPKHVRVMVVNQDHGALAGQLIAQLDHDTLSITTSSDVAAAKDQVRAGNSQAVIVFGPGFTADTSPTVVRPKAPAVTPVVKPPAGTHVQIFIDTTNQQLAGVVVKELAAGAQRYAQAKGAVSPITFDTSYAFVKAKDARYIDYFVPGIIAFAITLFTTLLTLLAFVGERTSGTLDRLRVTPVTEVEIVLGYELAFGLIAAVQGGLILLVAYLVYHILIVGPVATAAILVVLTAIDAQAVGVLISAAARRESQAVQFLPFIIFPTFLLSGVFVAVQSLPDWLRPFSYLLPPTWAIDGLRDVLLRGWGIEHVWPHVLVLAGFAIGFTLLAVLGLRRSRA